MRRFTNIDNEFCCKYKLNLSQAYVYEWILNLNKWCSFIHLEGKVYYWASKNKALSDMPIVTDKINTMHKHYKSLEGLGLIELKKIDGKDYIHITSLSSSWNSSIQHLEKNPSSIGKKSNPNLEKNPTNSTTNTNSVLKDSNGLFSKEEIKSIPELVIDYLNNKLKSKRGFQKTNSNLGPIKTRIKEGARFEDFKKVIDLKYDEWIGEEKTKVWLRPSTLFGNKFDSYIVQAEAKAVSNDGSDNFVFNPTSLKDAML